MGEEHQEAPEEEHSWWTGAEAGMLLEAASAAGKGASPGCSEVAGSSTPG